MAVYSLALSINRNIDEVNSPIKIEKNINKKSLSKKRQARTHCRRLMAMSQLSPGSC